MLPPALHPNVTPPPPNYVQTIELNNDDHAEADVTITKHVTKQTRRRGVKNHSQRTLELEDMQKYFHVPITVAAKEMKVGLTVLKRRCRELKITRWPHRKIKSLKLLIKNVKEMGLREEMVMLEEDMMLLLRCPDMELSDRTKRLRQACFKANYKKRRLFQIMSN
ncbi:Protein RKD4 [Linum perenne]